MEHRINKIISILHLQVDLARPYSKYSARPNKIERIPFYVEKVCTCTSIDSGTSSIWNIDQSKEDDVVQSDDWFYLSCCVWLWVLVLKKWRCFTYFYCKGSNLYLPLWARSHTMYAVQVDCSIFQPAKFEQTITHKHVLLWWESFIDGTAVTVILCWHVLISNHIFIYFWICWLFSVNMDV